MRNPAHNNGQLDSYAPRTASGFGKALQGFSIGDLPYDDVQAYLEHLLTSGASAEELLQVLHRHEQVEPLPEYAHLEISRILIERTVGAPTAAGASSAFEELRELHEELRALREDLAARDATIEELEAELASERASRAHGT